MAASSTSSDRELESSAGRRVATLRRIFAPATPYVPQRGRDALHIAVLCAFAVAEPLFQMLDTRPAVLADQGLYALVLLTGLLIAGIPLPLILLEELAGWVWGRLRGWLHLLLVSLLLTLLAWPFLKQSHAISGIYLIPLGMLLGLVGGRLYARSVWAQRIVTTASPGILLFPVVFLYQAPVWAREVSPPPPLEAKYPAPVVVIVFDEFCGTSLMNEDRQVDAIRYPHFAELAGNATWFRNATSVHSVTTSALPAILDGRYPRQDVHPSLEEHPQNLFTLLKATGRFEFAVFEPYTRLFPADRRNVNRARSAVGEVCEILPLLPIVYVHALFPADVPFDRPEIPRIWFGLRATWEVDRNLRRGPIRYPWDSDRDLQLGHFRDCLTKGERPALYFAHFAAPHVPWCYLPSGRRYRPDMGGSGSKYAMGTIGLTDELWQNDPLAADQGWQRYLLQLCWLDGQLGRMLEQLKANGLYDESLIVITADHGVSFRPGHSRRHIDSETLPDLASVPLFIKRPHQAEGRVDDSNVEAADVLPTILDILGIEPPAPLDGSSLAAAGRPPRPGKQLFEMGSIHSLDAAFTRRDESLLNMLERFGSGGDVDRLYALGPRPDLLGRRVSEFDQAAAPVGWKMAVLPFGESIPSQRAGLLPCYIEGRMLSAVDQPLQIAVAVNGVIRGVTRTYFSPGLNHRWSAMIPESAFDAAEVEMRLYVVSSVRGKTILEDCTPEDLQLPPQ